MDSGQPTYLQEIEQAIQTGEPVLLQNVLESLDPAIEPILTKALVQVGMEYYFHSQLLSDYCLQYPLKCLTFPVLLGNLLQLKIGDHSVQYHPNFRFFMTTKLPNPHYAPEVSTKTTIVNFAIKEEGSTIFAVLQVVTSQIYFVTLISFWSKVFRDSF